MSRFLIDDLKGLQEYVPGEQPRDKKYIKLNTNESPFPPFGLNVPPFSEPGRALKNLELDRSLNLYPDPECTALRKTFCRRYGIEAKNVIFGNGSDEILNFCFTAFFGRQNPVLFPDITYGFYKVYAELHSTPYTEVPLNDKLKINIQDYISAGTAIIIANPNAPTGEYLEPEEIEEIVRSNPDNIVIIDEAYIDFGGESAYPLCEKYDNLIVVGTFSKSKGFAGGRLGFAIANEKLIADLQKIRYSINPYNVNTFTQGVGESILLNLDYHKKNCEIIAENREYTERELEKLGFSLTCSKANFVFAKHSKIGGKALYQKLKEQGILVRHFEKERIRDYIRVTVGTSDRMKTFIKTLKQIIKGEDL